MKAIEAAADAGAQVVSMSLGEAGYSQTLQTTIDYAWQRNTLVVAAAGNDSSNELFFPAGANHAVSVSATARSKPRPAWPSPARLEGSAPELAPTQSSTFGLPVPTSNSSWLV